MHWLIGVCVHGLGKGVIAAFAFALGAHCAAWVACYGTACLETGELVGVVHLGWLLGVGGFRSGVGLCHVAAVAGTGSAVFVKGEGVDGLAMGGCWLGAEVEDPDDLRKVMLVEARAPEVVSSYRDHR